jgi:hypothetical protein
MINNELQYTLKSLLVSSLLLTTVSDCIRGFSLDLFAPLINILIPGDVKKPLHLFGGDFYINRFLIRSINLVAALFLIQYFLKR